MIGLLAAALGLLVAIATDVAVSRAGTPRVAAYGVSLAMGFGATLGFLVVVLSHLSVVTAATAILAYCVWWFAFLNLVQALESSLRVRLLGEVRAAGGRMSRSELEARYNDAALLRLRLDRMLSCGAVIERQGRLHITSTVLKALARFFRFLKTLLLGRISEFGVPLS